MGKMCFELPKQLPADLTSELKHSCLAGGFDNSPSLTHVKLNGTALELSRNVDESGYWITPWCVGDCGRLMLQTATLIESNQPYSAGLELARGKLNQLRNALAEWPPQGTRLPESILDEFRRLNTQFAQTLSAESPEDLNRLSDQVLRDTCKLIDQFVPQFSLLQLQRRLPPNRRLDAGFGCHLSQIPSLAEEFIDTFNTVCMTLNWREIEPTESKYQWDHAGRLLDWALSRKLNVTAGPLIDFSGGNLPDWLALWEGDIPNIANFMCDYVETVVNRFGDRIKRWHLTSGGNRADFLSVNEDETLFLTAKLAETALHLNPNLDLVVGVVQPWGEYLAHEDFTYSPLVFLDQLLRAGLRFAAVDVEIVPGVTPRGSYCRDLLELARILDHYSTLGAPLQVTLGFPSSNAADPTGRSDWRVSAGVWHNGFTPEEQSLWAEQAATIALSRPFVNAVNWVHYSDAEAHQFPHCGLIDHNSAAKRSLSSLSRIRSQFLK